MRGNHCAGRDGNRFQSRKVRIRQGHFYDSLLNIKSRYNAISHMYGGGKPYAKYMKTSKKKSLPHVANSNLFCEFNIPQQNHTEKWSTQWRFNQIH
jgi:hypothetical protein